jgi:ketosteroid isomerase-like protein
MKSLISAIAAFSLFSAAGMAQSALPLATRAAIEAGNQAWIDGMKSGNIPMIVDTYAENAVDCGPTGECMMGRPSIAQHMNTQLARLGQAHSATVTTWGTSEHGNFVYEWGQAEATFGGGRRLVDKYLTVWQRQADGGWKIFRNMVIPDK